MKSVTSVILSLIVACGIVSITVRAVGPQDAERAALAKAVSGAKVSLEKGLSVSARRGEPISAKFEIEEAKFQLSVYARKAGKFYEVIVDHNTGKIAKTEPITGGEDFTAAKTQSEAMAKAKLSLRVAVARALKGNQGFDAVSVFPTLKDGHPVAEITLVKGDEWKTVKEKLD